MSKKFLTILSLLWIVLCPLASSAEDGLTKTARWYKITWKGLYIADFKVEVDSEHLTSEIQSRGAVKAISKYSNISTSNFHKEGENYIPSYHNSYLTQRQGNIRVVIKYDNEGKITDESVVPPDKRYKRPAVKDQSKIGTVDPITAAVVARDKIKYALAHNEKNFSFNIYDGRRLSTLEFNIEGFQSIKVLDKNQDVVKITFRRIALEGFTNNELKRMKGEEPDIVVYLGKDDLLPLSANAAAPLGKAVFKLVKECESIEQCK